MCAHDRVLTGPRIPLRWGTAPTEVCSDCGAWRTTHHQPGRWRQGPFPEDDDATE